MRICHLDSLFRAGSVAVIGESLQSRTKVLTKSSDDTTPTTLLPSVTTT